ncbi:3-keto-5-aminohexanoate cleavage protein [Streptomyces sp. NPDC060031]|uniref:3-keto-5-aminohexanoate cleavage protein n=1 Tax=Streptomyces sp. NPDC060031 TaxID=3347043 RepID=UPI00368A4B13
MRGPAYGSACPRAWPPSPVRRGAWRGCGPGRCCPTGRRCVSRSRGPRSSLRPCWPGGWRWTRWFRWAAKPGRSRWRASRAGRYGSPRGSASPPNWRPASRGWWRSCGGCRRWRYCCTGGRRPAWPVLRLAARCGAGARTGVGDVLHLPDGRPARSNAELVAAAREQTACARTGRRR